MKTRIKAVLAAGLLMALGTTAANAAPFDITINFSSFDTSFDGTVQSTGDITMVISLDTNAPLLGSNFAGFYDAVVTVTAASLGLNNAVITSPTYFYINDAPGNPVIGFSDTVDNFSTIWTAYLGPGLPITDELDLTTLTLPFGPLNYTGTEFRTANAITFDNGSQFDAVGFQAFTDQNNFVSGNFADVPEPTSLALLGLGLVGMGLRRRKAA